MTGLAPLMVACQAHKRAERGERRRGTGGAAGGRHGELLGRWGLDPAVLVHSFLLLLLSVT
jgi:hypothetical protein